MSLKYIYAGSNQTDSATRIKGDHPGLTTAADGSFSTSGIVIKDPTGILSYTQIQTIAAEEDAASQPRVFTGLLYGLKVRRGPYLTGRGRQYEFEVDDLNAYLHLQPLRGAAAKRPSETGTARIAWLLGADTGLGGLVYDNGLVASNPATFDEADYRDRYPDEVLIDTMVNPSSGGGIFFVYWDGGATPGEEISLFYGVADAPVHDSTLRISNVPAVCDNIDDPAAVTFPVYPDPELSGSGSGIYCGVLVNSKAGRTYRHNQTTHDTFFSTMPANFHRVAVLTLDRIGRTATAVAHGDLFLTTHSGQMDTIKCTVKVPASKLTLIDAGMRLQVRFEHFPGSEGPGFTWTRVTRRTVLPFGDKTNAYYDVELELSTKGIRAGTGGDPGVFPHVGCSGPPDLIQSTTADSAVGSFTLGQTPIPGKLLVASFGERVAGGLVTMAGFTLIDRATDFLGNHRSCSMWYRVVQSGDGTNWPFGGVAIGALMEWNATGVNAHVRADDQNPGDAHMLCGGAITPPAGSAVTILGGAAIGEFDPVTYSVAPDAGVTELQDANNPVVGSPYSWIGYKTAASASGAYSVGGIITESTGTGRNQYAGITVTLVCDASTNPPAPGQWVYDELITMTGDTGQTAFPFADGSLTIKVDLLPQPVASYDGATGDFTLFFDPDEARGQQVFATYQGR